MTSLSLFPSRRHSVSIIETQTSLDWHYLQNINRQEEWMKREERMTWIIIGILLTYFLCTFPAAVMIQVDTDTKYSEAHIPTYIMNWLTGILIPLLYGLTNSSYKELARNRFCFF